MTIIPTQVSEEGLTFPAAVAVNPEFPYSALLIWREGMIEIWQVTVTGDLKKGDGKWVPVENEDGILINSVRQDADDRELLSKVLGIMGAPPGEYTCSIPRPKGLER